MTNNQKNLTLGLNALLMAFSSWAADPAALVEIPVEKVFAPYKGFDDNDLIQLVVDGNLPNACYSQGRANVQIDEAKKEITIVQMASVQTEGVCADPANLPGEFKMPIPFDHEINLGQLDEGSYVIIYKSAGGLVRREMQVEKAPTSTVDSLRYATILNAFVQDFVPTTAPTMEIRLTIQLNSSCARLSDNVQVIRQNDIYIVLPEVVTSSDEMCLPVSRRAYKVISVVNPGLGRYMLHVRSLGGNAKNKLFSVLEAE